MADLAQQEKCSRSDANHEKHTHNVFVGREPGLRRLKARAENELGRRDFRRLN